MRPSLSICLAQARRGDAEAFGELCRFYENPPASASDKLFARTSRWPKSSPRTPSLKRGEALRRYNGRCQFFTWLCAILLNRYRNTLRQRRSFPLSTLPASDRDAFQQELEQLADVEATPLRQAEHRDQAALVLQCVSMLPAKQQQIIYLRFYVDDSLEGIAIALGCSLGTVKSRLFSALEKLRAMNALKSQLVPKWKSRPRLY